MSERDSDLRVIALGVGLPLLVVLVAFVFSLRDGPDSEPDASTTTTAPAAGAADPTVDEQWNEALATTLTPLSTVLVDLASTVDAWSTGRATDDELRSLLDRVGPVVDSVRRGAADLADHPDDRLAKPLVVTMSELYVRSVDAHDHALASTGEIRTQWDRLGRRLRILADRIFDRARERTMAEVDRGPDVSVVLPAEVPDWERLEIAAGPPLVDVDPNRSDEFPLGREDDRATQTEAAWRRQITAIDAPTSGDVRAAADDVSSLDALARRLVAAAEALRTVAVPDGDRGRADRVALGWLVRADAARAAQLDALDGRADDRTAALVESLLAVSSEAALSPR